MSEYAQRFAENRIDFEILPDLTDQDLEKLGVVLGDRRKMLRAITNLGKTVDAPPSAPSRPAPPIVAPTVTPPAEAAGERRHVTVMFCDLPLRCARPRARGLEMALVRYSLPAAQRYALSHPSPTVAT